jgi:hypothetical protein
MRLVTITSAIHTSMPRSTERMLHSFRHFYARVQSVSTFDPRRVWPSDEQEDRVVKFPAGLHERPDA